MINTKAKLRTADGVLFCFLASMVIAILALNIGLLTEPEQILPKGLSMRTDEMNSNLLRGIDLALEDIDLIKAGIGSAELWRLLTFIHLDVFFYLALICPEIAAKTILTIGFYVRFGLCCSAMFYFLSEHIKLNRLPAALLRLDRAGFSRSGGSRGGYIARFRGGGGFGVRILVPAVCDNAHLLSCREV